jgi:hypothetical protein
MPVCYLYILNMALTIQQLLNLYNKLLNFHMIE